jgi:hypothetical protein
MSTTVIPQLALVPRDKYGNDIMTLKEIGLDGYVRCNRFQGRLRFSEIDVVKVVTGKNNNRAAEIINNMKPEVTDEVTENSVNLQFKGPGQKTTNLITYTGVIKLIMALPGDNAKLLRTKFADVLLKYFAGDESLVQEIERNRESTNPINVMAREELAATGGAAVAITRADLSSLKDELKQEIMNSLIKSEKSKRAKELYDKRAAEKHELAVIEKHAEVARKEREQQLEIKKRSLPIDEQYDAINERRFQREMKLLEKKEQLQKLAQPVPTEEIPQIKGKFTTSNVANYYKIYEGLDTLRKNRVFNTAWRAMLAEPYNLKPVGYTEDTLFGKKEPIFNCKDVHIMKSVLENARKDVLAFNLGE